ncbi:MAG: Asp-tRNA(Asn)/Glu-tRNA(Gln) amidotransferase subunit GatA [Acidimicrobiales bacterium]|nr:Asp-tRNA(Asn)/Glu-tRNA(Gln) amidotransferase subunit GatA [Acidimicrobiales bacterium]
MAPDTGSPDTAVSIAEDVRSGARSARSVLDAHLAAIDDREGEIHAFNLVLADEARAAADAIDARVAAGEDPGPLAGVPVALKDNLCTRGIPTTCSSKILEGWQPPYDATVVTRLTEAGAVLVGKTNLDEFAMGSSTENSAFGPTRNPRDTSRVPGGSSGGSTAAVAAGFAAVGLGSDTGGSIRQPAALCGVVGLKPTYGLVSRYGLVAFASSLDQIGPLTHTVADAARVLEVIGGHDAMDSTSIPQALPPISATLGDGVAGLRIGLVSELMGEGIAPDVAARVRQAAEALEAAGATVGEATVPAVTYGLSAYYLIAPAEASSNLSRYDGVRYGLRVEAPTTAEMNLASRTAGFGAEVKRRIMLGTYALSAGYYDAYYGKAQKVRTLILRDFAAAYEQFDLLLSPTSPTTAFPLGEKVSDPLTMYLNDICTIPSNLAGHPAVSVPFGSGDDGLPVGVQLLGPALSEGPLLRAAAVLEEGAPR